MPFLWVKVGLKPLITRCSKKIINNMPNKKIHRNFQWIFWRRERDSNPRYLSVQRFSRPPQSTTLPSLQARCKNIRFFQTSKLFFAIFSESAEKKGFQCLVF